MSNTTVAQFAAELNRPVDDLLKQLKEAGVNKNSGNDSITTDDKQLLTAYLQKKNRNNSGTISIRRKKTEVSTVDGVKVETRRRSRAVTIPSSEELAAEAKAKVAAENQKAEAEKAAAKAAEEKAKAEKEAADKTAKDKKAADQLTDKQKERAERKLAEKKAAEAKKQNKPTPEQILNSGSIEKARKAANASATKESSNSVRKQSTEKAETAANSGKKAFLQLGA